MEAVAHSLEHPDHVVAVLDSLRLDNPPANWTVDPAESAGRIGPGAFAIATEIDTFRTGRLDPAVGMRECAADQVVEEDIGVAGPAVDTDRIRNFAVAVRMGHLADHSLVLRG